MGKPNHIVFTPVATDADGISVSQTPAAGGEQSLTITGALASGGIATVATSTADNPNARQISITSAADETSRTFTVTGTDYYGNTISETITGANAGAATSTQYYKTVTGITVDEDTTGAITAGTTAVATSGWIPFDYSKTGNKLSVTGKPSGTATFDLEFTYGINASGTYVDLDTNDNLTWHKIDSDNTSLTAETTLSVSSPIIGVRLITSAYTSGTLGLTTQEYGKG